MTAARQVRRPQRWDQPFDAEMTVAQVERVLALPPFDAIDPAAFPAQASLHDTLLNDAAVRRLQPGDLACVRGEYGNSAFLVLSGGVRVVIDEGLEERELGRTRPQRMGWWRAFGQLWRNHRRPEVRDLDAAPASLLSADGSTLRLPDPPRVIAEHRTIPMGAGEMFGELAAMARVPRNASVFADQATELLEVRWQGLRELRRRSGAFRRFVDERYRERSLAAGLRENPLFRHLEGAAMAELAGRTLFESYGEFEWYAAFNRQDERDGAALLDEEPLIAGEGHYPDGLLVVASGFARVSEQVNHGHRTVGFLRRGDTFGLDELRRNAEGAQHPYRYSLRAIGYVDLLRIPADLVERHLLSAPAPRAPASNGEVDPGLLEFLVENRFINGTASMLVDLARCVRCDDCVRACALAHDDNPRFVRQGVHHGRFMVAAACMHCSDPVCMIGCPTGAIHRDRGDGHVVISDHQCIGCATCAGSCPFDAIRMVEVHDPGGRRLVDGEGNPILKATKCDFCREQPVSPQCERACPHDALVRIDLRDLDAVARWVKR